MDSDVGASLEKGFGSPMVPKSFTCGPRLDTPFPTITAAFNHWATTRPELLAAKDLTGESTREITYGELARRAQHLSSRLVDLGVRPGDRVPLVVKRGIEMLVGVLAILSSGAQYVPLDGGVVPDSTLDFVLRQAGSRHALCTRATSHRLRNTTTPCSPIVIEEEVEGQSCPEYRALQDLATPDSGCYVIYTSGTLHCLFPLGEVVV